MSRGQALALRAISSMATRQILEGVAARWNARHEVSLSVESVGGVDAARRVAAGEPFDLVFLALEALQRLAHEGHVVAGSVLPLMNSDVSVAVPAGTPHPAIGNAAAVRAAVCAAASVGVSTGPSGVALLQRFETWGLAGELGGRIRQAPAGVPVAALLARGEVTLGFQQTSELLGLPGIEVVGALPPDLPIVTTFAVAVGRAAPQPGMARAVLDFMTSAAVHDLIQSGGMMPLQVQAHHGATPS